MSYIRYTQALVVRGSTRRRADGQVTVSPGDFPTLGELQDRIGGEISHGFEVIGNNGRVLAAQTGFPTEEQARRGVRELRRALLPGVRHDVKELAKAWDQGFTAGITPVTEPRNGNPYQREHEEADRAGN